MLLDAPLSSLPLREIVELIFHWMIETPVISATVLCSVSQASSVHWYQYCRDVWSTVMVNNTHQQLGQNNNIEEIDESLRFKRKNNVGMYIKNGFLDFMILT